MPTQFPYPAMPWSQGMMRKAKLDPRSMQDVGRGYRELEGVGREKETKAWMLKKPVAGEDQGMAGALQFAIKNKKRVGEAFMFGEGTWMLNHEGDVVSVNQGST